MTAYVNVVSRGNHFIACLCVNLPLMETIVLRLNTFCWALTHSMSTDSVTVYEWRVTNQ